MAGKYIHTLYSQKTGLDITAEVKESKDKKTRSGMVQLRFFHLQAPTEGKTTQIKFNLEPWEAYDLFLKIGKVFRDGGKAKLTHKFKNGDSVEIVTNVAVEKWERGDKSGLGIAAGRDKDFISVPINMDNASRFLYVGEFLKFLSTRQQFVDKV
jgi:ribosomal protein L21E